MKLANPFLISGYHSPEYFCDRKKETSEILNALHNGRNITLIAPRRIGKTGLIKHTFNSLNKKNPEIVTLYMDIYSTQDLSDFIKLLASTVLSQLDSNAKKAIERVYKYIKSCRPVFTLDELTGMPRVSIESVPSTDKSTLKEIFDYLKSAEKPCYIAIDEFQQIAEYPQKGIEALLRSYIQFVPNVRFIFSGSKQHVMQEMFLSSKRPFYQSTQTLILSPIDKSEYFKFAEKFFKAQKHTLTKQLFDLLYEKFNGYTWYIQDVLNRLYSYNADINDNTVQQAIAEIVSENSYYYETLVNSFTSGNVRLMKAIANEGCATQITSGDFISKYGLKAASSVSSSIKNLIRNELVYKTDKGYIIYDYFMGEWLRMQP